MLIGKIEQKLQLDRERERSTHKGGPFEEIVKIELEAFHGSLGDKVRFVRNETACFRSEARVRWPVTT